MSKFTLDSETAEALGNSSAQLELVTSDGRSVGYFVSSEQYELLRKAFVEWANANVTTEELRRNLANPKRHTMEEVLKLVEGE